MLMPSSLFHAALGALIGIAILEEDFDRWALIAILTAAILPDIDSFLAIWFPGAHRVVLHNIFVVAVPALLGYYLFRVRDSSFLERHWGAAGERVFWTAVLVVAAAGIAPDMFRSGVNLFYPMHDQFYRFTGNVLLSTQHGVVQTLFNVSDAAIGTTQELYYSTGVESGKQLAADSGGSGGDASTPQDRRFPVFGNGMQLLLSILSFGIVAYQMHRHKSRENTNRLENLV